MYDAIIILGGSFISKETLPSWVETRLDAAIKLQDKTNMFLLLSRGSPHKVPCLDSNGHPIDECYIMANYMLKKKVASSKIILDAWSLDTIGNAYAALTMHAVPRNLKKLLIITSDFHMPRSRAIFEKVFSLYPEGLSTLTFLETESELEISLKEKESLTSWREKEKTLNTLSDLHNFIFTKHNCDNVLENGKKKTEYTKEDLKMYCV